MNSKIFNPVNKPRKTKDGIVRFRCDTAEKAQWVRQSRREGLSLTQWVTSILNDSLPK